MNITYELDNLAVASALRRKWSPIQTEECPYYDALNGGFCESDAQLRERIKEHVSK